MIIESSFFHLPELWIDKKPAGERDIASDLKDVIQGQLQPLIGNPTTSIDKAYKINKTEGSGPKLTADLHVEIPNVWDGQSLHGKYIIQKETWIEIKYFRPSRTQSSIILGTKEYDKIKNDLLKLCILIKESQGTHRNKSRYLCTIFYSQPGNTLKPIEFRDWIRSIMSPGLGSTQLFFPLHSIKVDLNTLTYSFGPLPTTTSTTYSYWGYLTRIYRFEVRTSSEIYGSDLILKYEEPALNFSQEDCEKQQKIGRLVIDRILSPS